MTLEQALEARKGKRLVFTNGVFDILHVGHIRYLARARELGDMLLVGVNSDASVRALNKGPNRPINPAESRMEVLEALRCVDGAVVFEEQTPETIIGILKPEVHVKGGDYRPEDMPETKVVEAYGGRVEIISFVDGFSTTSTLKKLGEE